MKTTSRRIIALLLTTFVLASFTACGQRDSGQNSDSGNAEISGGVSEISGAVSDTLWEAMSGTVEAEVSDDDVDGKLIVDHEEELQYAQFFMLTHYKGGYKSFTIIGGQEDYEWLVVPEGEKIRGHEFHYFDSEDDGNDCLATKPVTGRNYACVKVGENHWFGFPHLYYPPVTMAWMILTVYFATVHYIPRKIVRESPSILKRTEKG